MSKPKVVGSFVAGAGGGAVLVWAWGLFFPDIVMPPEVAAAVAGFIGGVYGPIVRKIEAWLAI